MAGGELGIMVGSLQIFSNRRLLKQIHFTSKWKLADPSVILGNQDRFGPGMMFGTNPDQPSPMQVGKAATLRAKYKFLAPLNGFQQRWPIHRPGRKDKRFTGSPVVTEKLNSWNNFLTARDPLNKKGESSYLPLKYLESEDLVLAT